MYSAGFKVIIPFDGHQLLRPTDRMIEHAREVVNRKEDSLASAARLKCFCVLDAGVNRVPYSFTFAQTEETPEELNRRMIVLPDQPLKLR